jgi:hypothetical protein
MTVADDAGGGLIDITRLSEDDLRELARIVRGIHARAAAKRERERQEDETRQVTGDGHDDTS